MAATFKIERNKDFTVMPNTHLRDKSLSLKAKGLHSLMLSLPESWDYTLKGLVKLSRDGRDGVLAALQELENRGYIHREQIRVGGKFSKTEYIIYQFPHSFPQSFQPCTEKPYTEKPYTEKPYTEKPTQSNTILIKHYLNKISYQSITKQFESNVENGVENYVENLIANIQDQIDHPQIVARYGQDIANNIIEIMFDVYISDADYRFTISRRKIVATQVKAQFQKLDVSHIMYVLDCFKQQTEKREIKNMKSYLLTALYNAPMTIDLYYDAEVNRNFKQRSVVIDDKDGKDSNAEEDVKSL